MKVVFGVSQTVSACLRSSMMSPFHIYSVCTLWNAEKAHVLVSYLFKVAKFSYYELANKRSEM